MIFDHQVTIPADVNKVWAFMMDVPSVAACVPGVERVEEVSVDLYRGIVNVRVGPISVHLEGQSRVLERDRDQWLAAMSVEATDRRIRGAVNARSTMRLTPRADGQTDMSVHTDAAILGKLGQFGQAVMRKKADQILAEFVHNMSVQLADRHSGAGPNG